MTAPVLAQAFPAGQQLARELAARNWTQADLAEILGRPTQFVSEIVAGKKEITRESAAQLGVAFGTTAEFWLKLQDAYFLWRQSQDAVTQHELSEVRRRARLNSLAPISLLVRRGVISPGPLAQQEREVIDLFDLPDIDSEPDFVVAARQSGHIGELSTIQSAWVACVRKVAKRRSVGTYNAGDLKELGSKLSTKLKTPEDFRNLPAAFADVGVGLVYVEQLPTSKIDGCSFILGSTPVIGISGRGKRLDKILFTLLHEVAHIALEHVGSKNSPLIVEEVDGSEVTQDREKDANSLAGVWVLPSMPPVPERVTSSWVDNTAREYGIAPIVLVGQLQKRGRLPWRTALVKDAPTVGHELQTWA